MFVLFVRGFENLNSSTQTRDHNITSVLVKPAEWFLSRLFCFFVPILSSGIMRRAPEREEEFAVRGTVYYSMVE